jgi:tRNA(Arg) A34 adenosine deaminase TadA
VADTWDEVFALMWEAYVAGTIPVGAVVLDESGTVVTRGRNASSARQPTASSGGLVSRTPS